MWLDRCEGITHPYTGLSKTTGQGFGRRLWQPDGLRQARGHRGGVALRSQEYREVLFKTPSRDPEKSVFRNRAPEPRLGGPLCSGRGGVGSKTIQTKDEG